ncbi:MULTISPECIES: DUF3572 domain-containing protein [unclassified Thioclava]|uniref:DUF3572 domain-containing protein n=1 Tax=unclassified Thioclava TaxID=2621713 RepID=UPI000995F5CA|nr:MULTISPECIES: DUF3572 domain-containing protein [unclassified Thioclava]MPQ92925.1 DUF3572 family protein [Thioclava sp. JE_KL1]OOY03910.1 hypothetical protein BMI87_16020 [Thioclava sp. F28-4]
MRQENAHTLALQTLGWLAGREDLIGAFLANSGASVDDLRTQASDPDFLAGVLDHVLQDDQVVLDCAQDLGVQPEALMQARAVLGRGDLRHWT